MSRAMACWVKWDPTWRSEWTSASTWEHCVTTSAARWRKPRRRPADPRADTRRAGGRTRTRRQRARRGHWCSRARATSRAHPQTRQTARCSVSQRPMPPQVAAARSWALRARAPRPESRIARRLEAAPRAPSCRRTIYSQRQTHPESLSRTKTATPPCCR